MNETFVTFHGWAGGDVRHRTAKDVSVATFRVAVTPRLRKDGTWVDGETAWYTVTAWRTLADHVRDSIRKGDPVIVHGRLRTETWRPDEGLAARLSTWRQASSVTTSRAGSAISSSAPSVAPTSLRPTTDPMSRPRMQQTLQRAPSSRRRRAPSPRGTTSPPDLGVARRLRAYGGVRVHAAQRAQGPW